MDAQTNLNLLCAHLSEGTFSYVAADILNLNKIFVFSCTNIRFDTLDRFASDKDVWYVPMLVTKTCLLV